MGNTQILQLRDTTGDTNINVGVTKRLYPMISTKFSLRSNSDKNGLRLIYLSVTCKKKRERISLDLKIPEKKFDKSKGRIICETPADKDIQLILDNIAAKVTNIKTYYRLADQVLTVDKLVEELKNNVPRGEFISYFTHELEKDKSILKEGTYNRHRSIIENLKKYKKDIYFADIDEVWFTNYKSYFMKTRTANTYYSNLKIIKKYLRRAMKAGIKLAFDLDEIKAKNIRSNRVDLNPQELKKLYNYYFSEFILPGEKIPLGTFLFSSFTSLRISDLSNLTREQIFSGTLQFVAEKTGKEHRIQVSKKALEIVKYCPELFLEKKSEQYINSILKGISQKHNIKKKLTLHVGRHTFATNYLRAGGKVEQLQKIMGHSELKETMGYVHIVDQEQDDSIMLLDSLF
jgi:integrase/recombinase XerD